MSKNILVISSSLRTNSNSETLADAFVKGAAVGNNNVEKITLRNKNIGFCKGCLSCQKTGRCVIHDDADTIAQTMLNADVLVFATPIYYYGLSGQLKTMLDRANPLYSSDYKFRDIYLLATAADEDKSAMDRVLTSLDGWVVCFPKTHLAGSIFAGGVNDAGDIKNNSAIDEAFELGRSIS